MLICPDTPGGLSQSPPANRLSICMSSSQICALLDWCWSGLLRIFPICPPGPLILGWAVRTARSLKGVELSALPTSGHLCDECPVSRPASYKVGISPSPITGRAEGSRFVLGSILLLYRVASNEPQRTYRGCACFPRSRGLEAPGELYQPPTHLLPCAFATLRPRSPPHLPLSLGVQSDNAPSLILGVSSPSGQDRRESPQR